MQTDVGVLLYLGWSVPRPKRCLHRDLYTRGWGRLPGPGGRAPSGCRHRLRSGATLVGDDALDVRVAEVASPRPGDRIVLDSETFVIQGEPVRDRERLVWTLEVRCSDGLGA
jgi:hypothetical protein